MHYEFSPATAEDIPLLNQLVNSAYRGEGSKKGWTTEADLLDGIRTDEVGLLNMLNKAHSVILKHHNKNGLIDACVYLEKQDEKMYLGMLTVSPELQGKGIGKELLKASETYARDQGCSKIIMSVISVRQELIAWYERHGYHLTNETKPFPNDPRFGIPKRPLEFIVMVKVVER